MANKSIKGITIKIGGDTVGLEKALSGVNKTSTALNSELRQVNNALKFDPTNTTLLAQKQELLSQQIKNTSDKLQQLKTAQQQVENQYKNGDIGEEAYRAFQREIVNTENQLAALAEEERNVGKVSEEAKAKTERFSLSLDSLKNTGVSVLGAMSTVAGAVGDVMKATVDAAMEAVKSSSEVGMSFEAATSQIAATMGKSVDEIGALKDKAKELGAATSFSATQAAEGLNILAMSGLNADQQVAAVGDVLDLAAAGTLSMASAASYTTGAVKGFKDEMSNAGYYTDLMAKGATMANTDVNNLGAALSESAATVNGYGQKAEGTTLALLRLAEQGVVGSTAANSMSRAMADLYTPTDGAKKALEELGVAAYDESEKTRDFNSIVDELNGKLSSLSDEQANAYKNTIFTTNGLNAFNKMTASSADKVEEFKEGLSNAAGSAKQQADTMLDNLQGDITIMGSAMDGLKITFYETFDETLRDNVKFATNSLSELTEAFTSGGIEGTADKLGEILVQAAQRAVKMIPELVNISKTFYSSVGNALTANAPALAAATGNIVVSFADGIAANTNTILNAVTSVGDSVLAVMPSILSRTIGSAGKFAQSIVSFFTRCVQIAGQRLPDILSTLMQSISNTAPVLTATIFHLITQTVDTVLELLPQVLPQLLETLGGLITSLLPQLINAFLVIVQSVVENAPLVIEALLSEIPSFINTLLVAVLAQTPMIIDGIITIADSIVDSLPLIISAVIQIVPPLINAIITQLTVFTPKIVDSGLKLITSLVKDLPRIISAITDAIPEIISAIIDAVLDALPLIIECGVELFVALVENLPEIIKGIAEAIPRIIMAITGVIENLHGKLVKAGSDALLKLIEDVPVVISAVKEKAHEIVQAVADAIYDTYGDIVDAGYNLITGLWQGIENAKDWIIGKIGGFTDDVVNAFKNFFDIHSPSHRIEAEVGEYNGMAIGTGTLKAIPKVKQMIKDATNSLFDDSVFTPNLTLASNDERMQSIPLSTGYSVNPMRLSGESTVINFTMHIDTFNNSSGLDFDDLMDRAMHTLYRDIVQLKLAR